jgi:hypothetical protein
LTGGPLPRSIPANLAAPADLERSFARSAGFAGFFPKSPGEEARKKNRFLPADLADLAF